MSVVEQIKLAFIIAGFAPVFLIVVLPLLRLSLALLVLIRGDDYDVYSVHPVWWRGWFSWFAYITAAFASLAIGAVACIVYANIALPKG